MARNLGFLGIAIGAIGIFFGFYIYFQSGIQPALEVISFTTVGLVGILAFFRHVVFHKSDAERLGFDDSHPEWQYEVGFANLAFGIVALLAYFGKWGNDAHVAIVLGFALYLFQAGVLHSWKSLVEQKRIGYFLRSGLLTFVFSGMMAFFAITALV